MRSSPIPAPSRTSELERIQAELLSPEAHEVVEKRIKSTVIRRRAVRPPVEEAKPEEAAAAAPPEEKPPTRQPPPEVRRRWKRHPPPPPLPRKRPCGRPSTGRAPSARCPGRLARGTAAEARRSHRNREKRPKHRRRSARSRSRKKPVAGSLSKPAPKAAEAPVTSQGSAAVRSRSIGTRPLQAGRPECTRLLGRRDRRPRRRQGNPPQTGLTITKDVKDAAAPPSREEKTGRVEAEKPKKGVKALSRS